MPVDISSSRVVLVGFAVVAATLLATATPATVGTAAAAPASTLDVASEHTTATDFQNADTLENVSVEGFGESAYVDAPFPGFHISTASFTHSKDVSSESTAPTALGFNSAGSKMYVPDGSVIYQYRLSTSYDVSTASLSKSNDLSSNTGDIDGIAFSDDGTKMFITDNNELTDEIDEYHLSSPYQVDSASYSQSFDVSSQTNTPGGITFNNDGTKMFFIGFSEQEIFEYDLSTAYDVSTASISAAYDVSGELSDARGLQFNSDGTKMFVVGFGTDAVHQYDLSTAYDPSTRTWVRSVSVGSEDGSPLDLEFESEGTTMVIVGNSNDAVYEYDLDLFPAQYVSGPHSATDVEEGWTNFSTLSQATATVSWEADTDGDGTFETTANQGTFSSAGNYTLDLSGTTADSWRVNVTFEPTGDNPTARLDDEGVLFESTAPTVDNSSASPSGGGLLSSSDVTLSIDVTDPDFATAQGDEVEVTFFVDGNQVGTDTLTANGTATQDITVSDGGSHQWSVSIQDSHGNTDTSDTFAFQVPGTITVYNESDPEQAVDEVEVEIRYYSGELIVEKSTTNGQVDMGGLPADQEFVVIARADGYHERRIYVSSLFEQQSIYLLPESQPAVFNVFRLRDQTGQYESGQTRLIIERALNVSGNLTWTTVAGDFFGPDAEFPTTLRQDRRYRLRIVNNEGDMRVLGEYMAVDENNPKILEVGKVEIKYPDNQNFVATSRLFDQDGDRKLQFTYSDAENETSELCIRVHERGNYSNFRHDECADGPFGDYTVTVDVPDDNSQWVANWSATRSGQEIGQVHAHGDSQLDIPLGDPWSGVLSMVLIMFTATLSIQGSATRGALVTVFVAGILMGLTWIDIQPSFWFVAATIAVGGHIRVHGVRL